MSSLGHAIHSARTRAALSQSELAARLGITQATVSFWERGVEMPTLDNLVKLLAEFPELMVEIRTQRAELIQQLRRIERALFDGQCACENCNCHTHAPSAAHE